MNISGIRVGHAHDPAMASGVTVVLADTDAVCAVDVRGGAPGTRETDAISGRGLVERAHAVVLSGGSAFGLAAAPAVQQQLVRAGQGFEVAGFKVPIVPQAILFDLSVGEAALVSDPLRYFDLGRRAVLAARPETHVMGSVGAGFGATTANLRGGLGWAQHTSLDGVAVAALVVVNAIGSVTVGDTPHFYAAPFERNGEFGGHGPAPIGALRADRALPLKGRPKDEVSVQDAGDQPGTNTTIGVIATTATLDQRGCQRLAAMAHTGLARAIHPVHTPLDGDTIFALATGAAKGPADVYGLTDLGSAGADCMARAAALAIYHADAAPLGFAGPPAYRERFQMP